MSAPSSLFQTLKAGETTLANRIALAPLTRGRATVDHIPTPRMLDYYVQRASAGLIISEATGISRQGLSWYMAPGIYTDEMVAKWKEITSAVENAGGKMSLQLWHMGRQSHSDLIGEQPVAPSAIGLDGEITTIEGAKKPYETPRALTTEEVAGVVQDYGKAAANAKAAGFHFVEFHSANGYLGDTFLQSSTNKRTDKYGGSIENRLTFMKEVLESISKAYPKEQVGIRFSPHGSFGQMGSADNLETFDEAIKYVASQGFGYISLMDGAGFGKTDLLDELYSLERARKIIDSVESKTVLIGNVGYTKEAAEKAVSGPADMIAFGRPFISNPDLVERFEKNHPLADEAPYEDWWTKRDEQGYTTYKTYQESVAAASESKA